MRIDDCYRILDLEPDASDEEIRIAYRHLSKIWHPDRFANDPDVQRRAEEKLKSINSAYDIITRLRSSGRERERPSGSRPESDLLWKMRMRGRERNVPTFRDLVDLARRGVLADDAEIFDPTRRRWIRLVEFAELRRAVRENRLRRYRFYAVAASACALFVLVRRPTPGGLIIAGLLFSATFILILRMRHLLE